MTVSSTTNTNSQTTVNATTHSFPYQFKIFADGDLEVIVRSAAGTETVKTLDTHYVVTNAGIDAGGNVLFKYNTGTSSDAHFSATDYRPASGETVLLRRSLSLTQGTDYIENDTFRSNSHEDALDRLTFITQSLEEELNRSFKVSKTNTIASAEFTDSAATRASKTLGFDSDGNLTTVADFLPIGGDAAQFTYSTTTTDADPGSGFIRFNNANLASASIAYASDNEINGTDVSAWVLSFDDVSSSASNRGRIRMSKSNTLDTWAVYKISGASTDASGYVKLALTYIDSAGTFANNDKVFLSFVATGAGETGATGAAGGSAADDLSLGDAAVTIATSAGNITIDAQGSDTDIIFKGTDGSSDITPLTLDMSEAGKAIFTGAATIAGLATVGGTLGVTGITTLANNLIIPNGGNIGSVGDTDAMAIASDGVVTFTQTPVGAGGGAMELVTKVTTEATDLTALAIAIPETTDFEYLKLIINLKSETSADAFWHMVCRNTADDTFDTGSTDYRYMSNYGYGTAGGGVAGGHDVDGSPFIRLVEGFTGGGSDDFGTLHLVLYMYHTVGTSKFPRFSWNTGIEKRHQGDYHYFTSGGSAMCSTAIGLDQIKFLKENGAEFTNQGYTLYKVKK